MSHLQTLLDDIKREAAAKSSAAFRNAALVELAGEICARINASGEIDVCFPTFHLDAMRPCVTLQSASPATDADFINALEAAGFAIEQMPARIASRNHLGYASAVYLMIAPGVDALLRTLPQRHADALAQQLPEAA